MTPRILALDLATRCGWAHRDECGNFSSGVWDLSPNDGGDMERLNLFRDRLTCGLACSVDLVVHEDTRFFRGGPATRIYYELLTLLKIWAHDNGLPLEPVNVASLKKFVVPVRHRVTERGFKIPVLANKEEMLDAARKKWPGVVFTSDDEADARWLAEFVATRVRGSRVSRSA